MRDRGTFGVPIIPIASPSIFFTIIERVLKAHRMMINQRYAHSASTFASSLRNAQAGNVVVGQASQVDALVEGSQNGGTDAD